MQLLICSDEYIWVPTPISTKKVPLSEISFIMASNKGTILKLTNCEEITSIINLKEFEKKLQKSFFQIHRQYIVNLLNAVELIEAKLEIKTICGQRVPLAIRRKKEFIKQWSLNSLQEQSVQSQ